MRLIEKQWLFTRLLPSLLQKANELGFEVSLGEAERTEEQAAIHAGRGVGIYKSLHRLRIALDLHLFRNEAYLTNSEDYRELGEWWEQRHELCRWGGRFTKPDGGHFSLAHDGRA